MNSILKLIFDEMKKIEEIENERITFIQNILFLYQ